MAGVEGSDNAAIPSLSVEEQTAIEALLKTRERFQPWTHRLVETIAACLMSRNVFPMPNTSSGLAGWRRTAGWSGFMSTMRERNP